MPVVSPPQHDEDLFAWLQDHGAAPLPGQEPHPRPPRLILPSGTAVGLSSRDLGQPGLRVPGKLHEAPIAADEAHEWLENTPEVDYQRVSLSVDAAAWYSPITTYGRSFGITITTSGTRALATYLHRTAGIPALAALAFAEAALWTHEVFHHRVEAFAVRHHLLTGATVYSRYERDVYAPAATPLSDGLLEESLATAAMARMVLNRFPSYERSALSGHEHHLPAVRAALADPDWLAAKAPGYRRATEFQSATQFSSGTTELARQVLQGTAHPTPTAIPRLDQPPFTRSLPLLTQKRIRFVP